MRRPTEGWLIRVLLLSFVTTAVVQAVRPMTSYKVLALGGSVADVGIVAAAFGLLSLFFAVPIGRWVDAGGESRFVFVGAVVMATSAVGTAFATSIGSLVLFQALLGLGHVGLAVGLQTAIANRGSVADHDSRFGAFSVTQSLGQLVGPVGAGFLAANGSHPPAVHIVFGVAAVASLAAAPLAIRVGTRRRSAGPVPAVGRPKPEPLGPALRRVFSVPSMPQALLGGITVVVSNSVLIAYVPAYGAATGLSVETVSLLLALRAAASIASRLLIGRMRTRVDRRTLLFVCLVGPALALFSVSLLPGVALMFVAMSVIGFGLGLGQPLTLSWIAGQAPRELRGTAVSLRLAGNRVGQFAVPAGLGVVGGIVGLSGVFWSLGLLLVLSALLVRTASFAEAPPATETP